MLKKKLKKYTSHQPATAVFLLNKYSPFILLYYINTVVFTSAPLHLVHSYCTDFALVFCTHITN